MRSQKIFKLLTASLFKELPRFILIALFSFAAIDKLTHFSGFVTAVQSYQLLPHKVGASAAIFFIMSELAIALGASQKVKPDSPRAVLSMNILGNELYVLSGVRDDDAKSAGVQVMDVYDKRNGNYLFSFKLPIACHEAIVHAERIYMLGDDGVTVWRFRSGESLN